MAAAITRTRTRIAAGIYRDAYGLAATVKAGGLQREKRFLPDTSLKTLKAWQDETRVALRKIAPTAARGTFAADARTYLATVTAMPTFEEREQHIGLWTANSGPARDTRSARPKLMRCSADGSRRDLRRRRFAIGGPRCCTCGTVLTGSTRRTA